MARRKRNSLALERANRRLESLKSISPALDFGDGLNIFAYAKAINDLEVKLATYNTALSTLDSLADAVIEAEKMVSMLSENMLLSVAGRYGRTSMEYEMAGGSRRKSRSSLRIVASAVAATPEQSPQSPESLPAESSSASDSMNGAVSNGAALS